MNFDKTQIARQFTRAAPTYDAVSQLQVEMSDQLIDSLPLTASGRLVDFGCGTGKALMHLETLNRFDLMGVDIAPGMICLSKKRVPSGKFVCCDLEHTQLDPDSIDVVFSNAAIQWCDCQSAIAEMMRVTRPLGVALVSTFGPGTLHEWRSAWQSVDTDSDRIHTFKTPQEIEKLFHEIGFESLTLSQVNRKVEFQSVDAMFSSVKQLGATNASLNRRSGLLGRQRYQQVRSVFEQRLKHDGKLTLSFDCIFVSASKPA